MAACDVRRPLEFVLDFYKKFNWVIIIIIIITIIERHQLGEGWTILFNIKKWFFGIFYQVNNLFLHQSYFKGPLLVKLTL